MGVGKRKQYIQWRTVVDGPSSQQVMTTLVITMMTIVIALIVFDADCFAKVSKPSS